MVSRRQRDEWTEFVRRRAAELRGRVVGFVRRLWGRMPAQTETTSGEATESKSDYPMTPGQTALINCLLVAGFVILAVAARTPIPSGKENREKVRPFLKEQFPDREVSPSDSVTAPVAVVFHLIRSGEPAVARRAIDFAAEQQFGYAAPYVIDRLGSGDPALEQAAQSFLRTIAGGDHGPDAESWRAWWRDPTRSLFGLSVGRNTLAFGSTAALGLGGLLLMMVGRWLSRRTVAVLGDGMLGLAWFMTFAHAMIRLLGSSDTCTFGASTITYFSEHGRTVGLEDARIDGGPLLMLLAVATFVAVPLLFMLACNVFIVRRRKQVAPPEDGERRP